MRTSIFSTQNCEFSVDESGDLLLTYLDGDPTGIKARLGQVLRQRKASGLNKVSWWGGRGFRSRSEINMTSESGRQIAYSDGLEFMLEKSDNCPLD